MFSVTGQDWLRYLVDNAVFSSWRLCCRKKWKIQHEEWRLYLQYYKKKLPYDRQRKCRWQAVCFNHQDPVLHNHGSQHTVNVLPHLACLLRQARGCSRPIRGTPGPTRGLIQVHFFYFYQTIIHIGTQQSSVCFLSHMRSNPRGTMYNTLVM